MRSRVELHIIHNKIDSPAKSGYNSTRAAAVETEMETKKYFFFSMIRSSIFHGFGFAQHSNSSSSLCVPVCLYLTLCCRLFPCRYSPLTPPTTNWFPVKGVKIQLQIQRGISRRNRNKITQVMESRSAVLGFPYSKPWEIRKNRI